MDERKLIVVDLDNTLFFTDRSVEKAAKEFMGRKLSRTQVRKLDKDVKDKIYDKAHNKYLKYSTANRNMVRLLKTKRTTSAQIIILTARLSNARRNTLKLLIDNKVPYDKFICRPRKYLYDHDEEWKLMTIKRLIKETRTKNVELYEDKKENIIHIASKLHGVRFTSFLVGKNSIKKLNLH